MTEEKTTSPLATAAKDLLAKPTTKAFGIGFVAGFISAIVLGLIF